MPESTMEPANLIRHELEFAMNAPPARVWRALVDEPSEWWHKDFYFTKSPHTMTIEAHAGGRVFEQSEDGGSLLWANVVALVPGTSLTMAGAFAPPYAGPGYATQHIELVPQDDGSTVLKISEAVFGHIGEDLQATLLIGWQMLYADGLKSYVEA